MKRKDNWKRQFLIGTIILFLIALPFRLIKVQFEFEIGQIQFSNKQKVENLEKKVNELEKDKDELKKQVDELKKQANLPITEKVALEIKNVFGKKSSEALAVADCESGLNPSRLNINTNGTVDHSVFQINSIHIKRFGEDFISDWKENIRVAKALYVEQGWQPWFASNRCHRLLARR